MKRYTVTWGDESKVVSAASEGDAWSAFADGNSLARSHPQLHERKVAPAPPELDSSIAKPVVAKK